MNLLHKELSYQIIGVLFKVHTKLGGGYQEKYYQRAIALELKRQDISFQEQVPVDLSYEEERIGKYYLDFVIENKIVLEIKAAPHFHNKDIKQVLSYLKKAGLELGILANFTKEKLEFRRILKGKN